MKHKPENYRPLLDVVHQQPHEYKEIQKLLTQIQPQSDNASLKSDLREAIKEALIDNDEQLAEILQAKDYENSIKPKSSH